MLKKLISCIVLLALMGSMVSACSLAAGSSGDIPKDPEYACWYCIDTCVADHPPFSDPFGYCFCIFGCTLSCHAPDPVPFGQAESGQPPK